MAYQLSEINQSIRRDVTGFLGRCDREYTQKVSRAAGQILDNLKHSPVVFLAGPSGSGKTTTAQKVAEELERRGVRTHTISLDNYFKDIHPRTAPRTAEGEIDLESPEMLDMPLLNRHLEELTQGREILIPKFAFARKMRDTAVTPLRLGPDEIAVFEGIHALNDHIAGQHPEAIGMYISAHSDVLEGETLRFKGTWTRLVRRAVRDYLFRGTTVEETMELWANVRRGEKLYISPYKGRAQVTIDSALPYEVPVMKRYAAPLLQAVPAENERHRELLELIEGFRWFEEIDPALVPERSLLREFLGGGSYQY
ncbi:MAG: nucleoside kinase [Oscillospiraceae bacterium]|nr:nucleoside kinase [Oscillospiraceae bacterium]